MGEKKIIRRRRGGGQETKSAPSILVVLRRSVGPAFAMAGLGLMPAYYPLGVCLVYIGLLITLFDILLEPFIITKPTWVQLTLFAVVLALFDWFTIGKVCSSARLEFDAYSISVPHFNGDVLGGLKWTDKQIDLRVWIRNPTTTTYEKLDMVVDTNAYIEGAGQLQTIPSCTVGPSNELEAHATLTEPTGAKHLISPSVGSSLGLGYRIVCDKFPPLSAIQLVLATAVDHSGLSGFTLDATSTPNLGVGTARPTVVTVKGVYTSAFRERKVGEKLDVAVR